MTNDQELERPFFGNVEALFSEYVEYYGGKVVDKLKENTTDRPNADFIFDSPEIVAELKTFQKDVFSGDEDIARFENLLDKWLEKKMMTPEELRRYIFEGEKLPNVCLKDVIEIASKTIERAVYKANKQIKETKQTFDRPNANGIVFLINDGNYFFSNQGFLSVIADLVGRKFKDAQFDVVIYLTINQATQKSESELDYQVWIPIYTKIDENAETIASNEFHCFVNDFGSRFFDDFMTRKAGYELLDHDEIENIEDIAEKLKKHRFISKEIIYKK